MESEEKIKPLNDIEAQEIYIEALLENEKSNAKYDKFLKDFLGSIIKHHE